MKRQYGMRFHFYRYVVYSDTCWEWRGYVAPNGYGQLWDGTRIEKAHRFSYRKHIGPIPKGKLVCHHCDNRRCVRPEHLFLGTHADNLHDMDRKGRSKRPRFPGESNGNAKLTATNVRTIRAQYRRGLVTAKSFADKFDVSEGLIRHIIKGRAWRHV